LTCQRQGQPAGAHSAHITARICPEPLRTAESSAAGQGMCGGVSALVRKIIAPDPAYGPRCSVHPTRTPRPCVLGHRSKSRA
jgi:hypothetical protein